MRVLLLALAACGTTGGQVVTFDVAGAGPADATGGSRIIDTALGWHVVLDKAKLHVGAIYLNLANPISGSQSTECILPGIYTAEELVGLDVDVLSATPQPFPAPGTGTDDRAKTAEVWLTGGDVNAANDTTIIADICGTATSGSQVIPFGAQVTIGGNRLIQSSDPSMPSAHPICKQRIVTPIPIDLSPVDGSQLLVRIDPVLWFANVDFAGLPSAPAPSCSQATFAFPDDLSIAASQNLFTGLRAASGTYTFTFQ